MKILALYNSKQGFQVELISPLLQIIIIIIIIPKDFVLIMSYLMLTNKYTVCSLDFIYF
jgi:hypothetical protein